ncbi:MAG: PAS domain S-box protein [Desulfuromonadales bacterium]|nr:PAS domain S-box protein [Desulfuromonadales bacterium]MBN2792527.1 PAS domain S-box protein [Desulfuromonadales bacterium]
MKRIYLKFLFLMIVLIFTIFILWNLITDLLIQENQRSDQITKVNVLANQIEEIISKRLKICETLAKNKIIQDILGGRIDPKDKNVRQILKISNEISHTELIYLINRDGISVESSGSREMSALVGQDYSFRPYFQNAIKGEMAVFPAVGVVTGTRGLHLSSPVYSGDSARPNGVVAMKIGVAEIELLLKEKDEKISILSPEGIVFASNQPKWLLKSVGSISASTWGNLRKTKQYVLNDIKPLNIDLKEQDILIDGKSYFVARAPLSMLGWELVSCFEKNTPFKLPPLYYQLLGVALGITGGLAILIFFLLENIQYRKHTEKKLIYTENKYKNIFDNAVMGIYQSSLDGKFIDASPSMAELLGYEEKAELVREKKALEIYKDQKDRNKFVAQLKANNQTKDFETQFIKKDGTSIWVTLSGRLALNSNQESIIEGFCLDITEKKKVQEDLRRERDIFSRVMDSSPISIMLFNARRQITFANFYAENFLELQKGDLNYEKPLWKFKDIDCRDLAEDKTPIDMAIHSRLPLNDVRCALCWPEGRRYIVSTSIAPLFDAQGDVTEMVVVLDDITDKIRAEQEAALRQKQLYQADRMISMGIMASGVAHEINNPNTFILANAEMLKETWKESKAIMDEYYKENGDFLIGGMSYSKFSIIYPDLCARIIDGSRRIKRIIKELKFFSSQEVIDLKEHIDINSVINSAEILLSSMIKRSTTNFTKKLDPQLPPIKGNSQRLEQVMINIIQNACQALNDPSKAISIMTRHNRTEKTISIICKDEGIGIDKENIDHIKDPFFTTKRDQGGTGLGLSVSETIVREFRGTMDFESIEGQGTKVVLTFPV